MLLKFGAVLSIICGFLMVIYAWTHLLQSIVVVQSFLRMLELCKLAVRKLYLSGGGSYSASRCVRTWIILTPEYPFNYLMIELGCHSKKSGNMCRLETETVRTVSKSLETVLEINTHFR